MAITGAGAVGTSSYLSLAYGRAAAVLSDAGNGSAAGEAASSSVTAATVVTLSAAAQARLAQGTAADFASISAAARAALDALYQSAKAAGPRVDGQRTVDLSSLDRRALYAIAINGGGKFSADEQAAATDELQARFDAVLSPQAAVAGLTGDWSQVYKAALDFMQGAGPEEKSTAIWNSEVAALQQGYATAAAPSRPPPAASGGDPVAAFLARTAGGPDENPPDLGAVTDAARAALDAQRQTAAARGLELVFSPDQTSGQSADWSGFDNRALAAVALNAGDRFSPEEARAAKTELGSRIRASLRANLTQSGAAADPRAFSVGLLSSYARMSVEERAVMNFTPSLQDMAVKNYQTASSLMTMLHQAADGSGGLFG